MPILPALFLLADTIGKATEAYNKLKEAAKQNSELTPEQEKELDDYIAQKTSSHAWKTDEQLAQESATATPDVNDLVG